MLLPIALLRSCLLLEAGVDPQIENNLRMITRELQLDGVDGFILDHLAHMLDISQTVPTLSRVRDWCMRKETESEARASAALARLEGISAVAALDASAFRYALDEFKDLLLRTGVSEAFLEGSTILSTGLQTQVKAPSGRWEPKLLQGPMAAIDAAREKFDKLTAQVQAGGRDGEFRKDITRFKRELSRRAANPQGAGAKFGIQRIDEFCGGLQPGQLALVLGYTSHLKSTISFNWAYRTAIIQGLNVGYVPVEMTPFSTQGALLLMHAAHLKFQKYRVRLTADKLKTGLMSEIEEKFLTRVMEDFEKNPDYGRIFYREPTTVGGTTIQDIHRWAERIHRDHPLSLLVIDYLGLIDLGQGRAGLNDSATLNQVVRQAKLMANGFDHGRGLAVLSPFQSNREGFKDAEKNGGRYKLTAMFLAPEAEKSADIVISTYLDEGLMAMNEALLGHLKNREGRVFTDLVKVHADADSRVIRDLDGMSQSPDNFAQFS